MNPILRLLAVGTLLTAATAFAADAFEGKVSFTITSTKSGPMNLDYTLKPGAARIDIDGKGQQVSTIMDMNKHEMTMLIHQQRMYIVRPMPSASSGSGGGGAYPGATAGAAQAAPEVTGKTEVILGYTCRQVLVKDKDRTTELWLAEGLGMFMGLGSGGSNPMMGGGRGGSRDASTQKWEEALKGIGGFPMRVVSRDASGKETFRMEATKVAPGSQPDSEFMPPEGYQSFQMPGGMNPFGH